MILNLLLPEELYQKYQVITIKVNTFLIIFIFSINIYQNIKKKKILFFFANFFYLPLKVKLYI